MFVRHRNSKRLSARTGGGRFSGTPNLGAAVCPKCGAIHLPQAREEGGFALPPETPKECRNGCGPFDASVDAGKESR